MASRQQKNRQPSTQFSLSSVNCDHFRTFAHKHIFDSPSNLERRPKQQKTRGESFRGKTDDVVGDNQGRSSIFSLPCFSSTRVHLDNWGEWPGSRWVSGDPDVSCPRSQTRSFDYVVQWNGSIGRSSHRRRGPPGKKMGICFWAKLKQATLFPVLCNPEATCRSYSEAGNQTNIHLHRPASKEIRDWFRKIALPNSWWGRIFFLDILIREWNCCNMLGWIILASIPTRSYECTVDYVRAIHCSFISTGWRDLRDAESNFVCGVTVRKWWINHLRSK